MTGEVVVMIDCPFCNQPVRPDLHTAQECRDNLKQALGDCNQWTSEPETVAIYLQAIKDRDEARAAFQGACAWWLLQSDVRPVTVMRFFGFLEEKFPWMAVPLGSDGIEETGCAKKS